MRGEHVDALPLRRRHPGIIPACAGSTLADEVFEGEIWGSSPHARGALFGPAGTGKSRRIIPACAGSTIHMINALSTGGDHPRMRGEHLLSAAFPG